MTTKQRYEFIIDWFSKNMPKAESELNFENGYQAVVSVILSAQCTDKRVNMVTPQLFERFPNAESMANSSPEEIYEYIKSISYPNNKAKNLHGMAKTLVMKFNSVVPDDVELLQELPGVGRKTANVVAAVIYGKFVMPVDTHVFRVSDRIGLTTKSKTPLETERQLVENFPAEILPTAHHWLILHGRYVCVARKPKCNECGISVACRYFNEK